MTGVDLNKDGQEVDAMSAEALSDVKVTIQIAGEAKIPTGITVALRAARKLSATERSVDSKGLAEFEQVASGAYEIFVQSGPLRYSIAHIGAEGAQVSGQTVTIAAGSSPSIALSLVAGDVEVDGIAHKAGRPFAGAMIVLVPNDPEMNHSLFRRDQSDLDGTFTLRGVVPGAYTLLAIEDGWDLDWSQTSVISAYVKHGKKIQVVPQSGRHMNITEAVAVQSK